MLKLYVVTFSNGSEDRVWAIDEADAREQMQFFCVVREICTVSEIDK